MKPFFLWWKKKQTKQPATLFHQSMPVCIKQIMACKPLSAFICHFKVSFTIKWKKSCQTIYIKLYSRIFVWKYRLYYILAHICDRRGDFVEDISFLAEEQNFPTVSLIGSTCVCFCRKTLLLVFNLTQFDWLPAHLREMKWRATNQGVFFLSTASSGRCPLALSPSPTSTVHSNSKSNMVGRKNDRELITLARPNNTPALQARLTLILDNVEFPLQQRALRNFMRYVSQNFRL